MRKSLSNASKIFERIYDQYIEKIYRFIYLKVSSREQAEDLTSEVFSRYWKQLKQGEKIKNPQAFLYRISHNLLVDYYREKSQTKLVPIQACQVADPAADLEEKAVLGSDIGEVRLALANLSPDYQNVIIWRYLEELSVPEIAKISGKSAGAVRVMLHRGLQILKDRLNTN